MRVGVIRSTSLSLGGAFQYEVVLLEALAEVAKRCSDEIFHLTDPDTNFYDLVATGKMSFAGLPLRCMSEPDYAQPSPFSYLEQPPIHHHLPDATVISLNQERESALRRMGVNWIFNLTPSPFAFEARMPFVMPIHDLQHRIQPHFPEVSINGENDVREYLFGNACRFATFILVDSEQGRQDVLRYYGDLITEDRIRILPFFPPMRSATIPHEEELRQVAKEHKLPPKFFFYPAQFWRHKNHHLIINAIRRINDLTGETIPVVFCGSYADRLRAENFVDMGRTAIELRVLDQIRYLGWVPDSMMPALYRLSSGLVMPTFFGPTNLPVLEAWHFGCPVITSDIPGIREQIGDAGLLIDPNSPEQLAEAMLRLWHDQSLTAALVEKGKARLASYSWNDFVRRLSLIVDETSARLRDGQTPSYPET